MGVPTRQDSGGLWIAWMVVSRDECYASTGPVSKSAAEDYARDQPAKQAVARWSSMTHSGSTRNTSNRRPRMANGQRKPRRRGRPARPMPEPIPDTPENVVRALMTAPPKRRDGWDYLQDENAPD